MVIEPGAYPLGSQCTDFLPPRRRQPGPSFTCGNASRPVATEKGESQEAKTTCRSRGSVLKPPAGHDVLSTSHFGLRERHHSIGGVGKVKC